MLADHLDIRLESLEVRADAECDVRGCLLIERKVPVGFQRMQCRVRLQPNDDVEEEALQMLLTAEENSCVVMQTLRSGVPIHTQIEASNAREAIAAAAPRPE